jgi:IS30 family transposase
LTQDTEKRQICNYTLLSKLKIGWSPEQIAGRLRLENAGKSLISHETIYSYIYSDMAVRNQWYSCLRKKRRYRRPRVGRKPHSLIPNRVAIADRPSDINERLSFGHWEGDLMLFKQGIKTNLITLRERKSRLFVAIKNPTKQAESTASNIIDRLGQFDDIVVKSLTFDNGREFARHESIAERLGAKTYFCDPYKSYQKGSVENGNGVMREWLPRTADIEHTSQQQINAYAKQMNSRPMKLLGYRTPEEVFWAEKTASFCVPDTS